MLVPTFPKKTITLATRAFQTSPMFGPYLLRFWASLDDWVATGNTRADLRHSPSPFPSLLM